MALLRLIGFTGEVPKLEPRLLAETAAQNAFNTRLTSGNLQPIRKSRFRAALPAPPGDGYKTIYRHAGAWLAWAGVVNAAPGPVASDRLYYTGEGAPKVLANGAVYDLALSAPPAALSASLSGAAGDKNLSEDRLYVYTEVTVLDEESAPSPVSNIVTWTPGQTVTLNNFRAPSGRVNRQRIYRSQTSTSGTTLYFVAERGASAAAYTDNLASTSLGEPLPSLDYNPAPAGLTGLIPLPNGMMAAFVGKDLYFSEPFMPHAWPEKYVLTMDYNIVGLGAYGTTVVVMTQGNPYIVSGTAPENMVSEKLEFNLPCVNARGIQDLGYAIAYPSNDGLVLASSGGVRVASEDLFTREGWQTFRPENLIGGQHDGRYFAAYSYSDMRGQEFRGSIILDLAGREAFVSRTKIYPSAFFYDVTDSKLYYALGSEIYEWDALGEPNEIQLWRSKPFILPKPGNMGAILVEARASLSDDELARLEIQVAKIKAENASAFEAGQLAGALGASPINGYALNGDLLQPVPSLNQSTTVNIYADRKLVATVTDTNIMKRLPSGFLAQQWEVEVSGDMVVTQVMLATTGAELAGA